MSITLESIEAKQTELAELIAKFKTQAAPVTITIAAASIELAAGEHYAGLLLNDDGSPSHHLILLPGEAGSVDWDDAKAWASNIGGELPTRREQSLLFANLRGKFESAYYWSSEAYESGGSYAWYQFFSYGFQYWGLQSNELRARAVRRVKA